jgi:hypothetical protein
MFCRKRKGHSKPSGEIRLRPEDFGDRTDDISDEGTDDRISKLPLKLETAAFVFFQRTRGAIEGFFVLRLPFFLLRFR